MPEFTPAVVKQGKKAFLTVAAQCHGDDSGRAAWRSSVGVNAWETRPRPPT